MLLRAPGLALRPARVGFGAFGVLLVGLIWRLPGLWGPAFGSGPDVVDSLTRTLGWAGAWEERLTVWGWLALGASGVVLSILGGAIARSVATEVSLRRRLSWPAALRFGVLKWPGFAGLVLIPLVGVGLMWLFLVAFGWVMLTLPVVQVLGGALYGLALLVGGVMVLLLVGLGLGLPMLAPSLACEGIDAIDSLQRSLAYVARRPMVLGCKLALLGVLGWVLLWGAGAIAEGAANATWAAVSTTGAASRAMAEPTFAGPSSGSRESMRALVRGWSGAPGVLVLGLGVSFFFSAGTLLYLSMRHACDGQDPEELWSPAGEGGGA